MPNVKPKKIVWSFDPFVEGRALVAHSVESLKTFTKGMNVTIEPVYVLVPKKVDLMGYNLDLFSIKEYKAHALDLMKKQLKGLRIKGLQAPKVIDNSAGSNRGALKELVSYATRKKADMFAVSSHCRKGLKRAFLGSFAESLVLNSPIPTLIMGASTRAPKSLKNILFPTDFTKESWETFQKLLDFAGSAKSKITLFHQVEDAVEPYYGTGLVMLEGSYVPVSAYLKNRKKLAETEGAHWAGFAAKHKVKVDVMVNSNVNDSVSEAVLKAAKRKKVNMIAIASESGVISATLIGSVSREVLRGATCPVWLLHPQKKKKGARRGSSKPDSRSYVPLF